MNGRRIGWLIGALAAAALMASCAMYQNDRAWLSDTQYGLARAMYIQTGSLDLVQRQLTDMEWRRGHINEAMYRLQKEFEILPEELPVTPPAPEGAAAVTATTSTLAR